VTTKRSANSQGTRPWYLPSKSEIDGLPDAPVAPPTRAMAASAASAVPRPSALKRRSATPVVPASPDGGWRGSSHEPPQTQPPPAALSRSPSPSVLSPPPFSPLVPPPSVLVPAPPAGPPPAAGWPRSDAGNQSLATPAAPLLQVAIPASSAAGCGSSTTTPAVPNPPVAQNFPLPSAARAETVWVPNSSQTDGAGHSDPLSPSLASLLTPNDPCLPKQPAGAN